MSCLYYKGQSLYIENCSLQQLAHQYGSPCYFYSKASIKKNWESFENAFAPLPFKICYAVKANSNIAILQLLSQLNAGFDIVSLGELQRVLKATDEMQYVFFSGVGKTQQEIERAIDLNIYCFDVESLSELKRIQAIASKKNKKVNIALRINPHVDVSTHAYIHTGSKENKFGIDYQEVISICRELTTMPALQLIGLAFHIGSQLTKLSPFLLAFDRLLVIYHELIKMGFTLRHLNLGGGLGITYQNERPPSIQEYAQAIKKKLAKLPVELIIEPGRALVGNAGVLLTRVEYLKHSRHRNFAIVDAGMNDFIRPALYQAWQNILPVISHLAPKKMYDIVGPVCESADFFGKDRLLSLQEGDFLVIDAAGAYGFTMSSNYNSRLRASEVIVSKNQSYLVRRRETFSDLIALETLV